MTWQIRIFRDSLEHRGMRILRAEDKANNFLKEIGDNVIDIKINVNPLGLRSEKTETIMVIYKVD